jgi:glycosyltransferase involved in cell wall biosynthesis
MPIAYVSLAGRGATDALIAEAVARVEGRLAGTVQRDVPRAGRSLCDMELVVLPDGPVFRINQDRGEAARGCRLDGGALEEAVVAVAARLGAAEALVVNKFGKLEAQGRGYVPLIAEAMARDLPVLVGVNGLNLPDLLAFCDGLALALPADAAEVAGWMNSEILQRR